LNQKTVRKLVETQLAFLERNIPLVTNDDMVEQVDIQELGGLVNLSGDCYVLIIYMENVRLYRDFGP
jgi:hypothetical protein